MSNITSWTSALYPTVAKRYTAPARWFHWLTALLVFAVVPLGWIFSEFKTKDGGVFKAPIPGNPGDYASAHKTLGLAIFLLVVIRLAYRITNQPPALPARTAMIEKGLSHATHWILYLVLLAMPISGYIMSSASKNPISIFGLFDFPKLPVTADMAKAAHGTHIYLQFAVYGLVILHLASVCWHLFVRRDDLLARMLPRQTNTE